MKIVIRAGGVGTRLWPISRQDNPKQFQNIIGDKTMLRTTYERIAPALKDASDLFISVNERFKDRVLKEVPEIGLENTILETDTRNTGPAMCLEVCFLSKKCDRKEIIASLPSDDYISDAFAFRNLLVSSEKFLLNNPEYILTPAIRPDYPDTGYTYFKAGKNLQESGQETIYSVADTVEKPNYEYCGELLQTGIYYCHTGMYLWQLGHISDLFQKLQPSMYKICCQIVSIMLQDGDMKEAKELYSQLEKISVESAVTDKAEKIAMSVSNLIGWSDLGKWHIIKRILSKEKSENLVKGKVITQEASNNLIFTNKDKKIVVVNDINDLVIVDTEDALFISSLEKSAEIKTIIKKLREINLEKYL